tara:strand:- start:470 stop:694 length:225 start_codon:yes stop_codon:yes gene_type:complete
MKQKLFAATSADTLRFKCGTGHPARLLRSTWVGAWEVEEALKASLCDHFGKVLACQDTDDARNRQVGRGVYLSH